MSTPKFDVVIIGGSFAGLSAGLALGRSLRDVLIVDSGDPCNKQVQHAHNFLTQDGKSPQEIASLAKLQLKAYKTVQFYDGPAVDVKRLDDGFKLMTNSGDQFIANKLILATGVNYLLPETPGFSACWGLSIFNCPYCHGYENSGQNIGILGNGNFAFGLSRMISRWSEKITIYTQGIPCFTSDQLTTLNRHHIRIEENTITSYDHTYGQISQVHLNNHQSVPCDVVYTMPPFEQKLNFAPKLGYDLTENGLIEVDQFQKTIAKDVFACGDCADWARVIPKAVATGNIAGVSVNNELVAQGMW